MKQRPVSDRKTQRRLRSDIDPELAARIRGAQLQELYERPVGELDPDELAVMRAAFLDGRSAE